MDNRLEKALKEFPHSEEMAVKRHAKAGGDTPGSCVVKMFDLIEAYRAAGGPGVLDPATDAVWLVWSNECSLWWAANRSGYANRTDVHLAGRYTLKQAQSCESTRSMYAKGNPPEMVYPSPELLASLGARTTSIIEAGYAGGVETETSSSHEALEEIRGLVDGSIPPENVVVAIRNVLLDLDGKSNVPEDEDARTN